MAPALDGSSSAWLAEGGWRDTETLLQVYQQPTNEALLAVMSEERKVRDVSVAGGNG